MLISGHTGIIASGETDLCVGEETPQRANSTKEELWSDSRIPIFAVLGKVGRMSKPTSQKLLVNSWICWCQIQQKVYRCGHINGAKRKSLSSIASLVVWTRRLERSLQHPRSLYSLYPRTEEQVQSITQSWRTVMFKPARTPSCLQQLTTYKKSNDLKAR